MITTSVPRLLSIFFISLYVISCTRHATPEGSSTVIVKKGTGISSPGCIIYRTRTDYSNNVPVGLSEDKTKIVSYPDIRDIYYNGSLAVPTVLAKGFLLDNRGIGPNVAFLKYSYTEYSQLSSTPPVTELMKQLLDKDPLVEMYRCGPRSQYADIEKELNELIISGKLSGCKKLK